MFWKEEQEKLCVECYEKKYGNGILSNTLKITREKEKCERCGEIKNIVLEESNGYLIFK